VRKDKESDLVIHNQQDEAESVHSRGRVSPLEVQNRVGSPTRKTGQNKSWMDSAVGGNQFQELRELLGDYPSFNCNSVGGDSVIPESAFDGVVGAHSQISPCVIKKDCIVYSRRKRKERGR